MTTRGKITFKDFYETEWLPRYVTGGTGRTRKVPSEGTVTGTKGIFRLHLLPLFGKYSLNWLNENPNFVVTELTILSEQYANIKIVKSYMGQLFEIAEVAGFIEFDRISKPLKFIAAPKKERLEKGRVAEGLALTANELLAWIDAVKADLDHGKWCERDYVLFMVTMQLGDRKSESYGLDWQHVDLENGFIYVTQALKSRKLGPTKGRKETKIQISDEFVDLLATWKDHQADELASVGITGLTGAQLVFTAPDSQGHMNRPLHADFLNNKLKYVKKNRHPDLAHLNPHKLRHTYATLALEGGASMKTISEALTHSDEATTRVYVNTPNVVGLTMNDSFKRRLAEARAEEIAKEKAHELKRLGR
ncbi:tyrosine-type recombinase/integrase [Agrilactobacillus yilanensis]|uniref:Tyrosine-type recombinase/integrase n=1 Tax=Agrilactobacillus yilanensis TaxID=2485997 RepID=A0ABW4JA55_9LACO|nr:site-specific integrase [Agrilactobacillus yilanensis]